MQLDLSVDNVKHVHIYQIIMVMYNNSKNGCVPWVFCLSNFM